MIRFKRTYRCKCGKTRVKALTPPPMCVYCSECNTTLSDSPGGHHRPRFHIPIRADKGSGYTKNVCLVCGQDLPEDYSVVK